jgi:geranylgeranyl pyrophosphate synthase
MACYKSLILIWDNPIIHDDEDYVSGNTNKIGRVVWQKRNQEWSAKMTDEEKQERLENVVKLISKTKGIKETKKYVEFNPEYRRKYVDKKAEICKHEQKKARLEQVTDHRKIQMRWRALHILAE